MTYRRKGYTVEALQYNGQNEEEIIQFIKMHTDLRFAVKIKEGDFVVYDTGKFYVYSECLFKHDFEPIRW